MALIPSSTLVCAYAGVLLTIGYFLLTAPVRLLTSAAFLIVGDAMHIREASFQPSASRLAKGLPALSVQSTQLLGVVAVVLASNALAYLLFAGGLVVPTSIQQTGKPVQVGGGNGRGRSTAAAAAPTASSSSSGLLVRSRSRSLSPSRSFDAFKAQRGEDLHTLVAAQVQFLNLALAHVVISGGLCAWIYVLHSGRTEKFFSSASSASASSSVLAASQGLDALGDLLGNQVVFSAALADMLFWGYLWTVIRDERREVIEKVHQIKAKEEEEAEENDDNDDDNDDDDDHDHNVRRRKRN